MRQLRSLLVGVMLAGCNAAGAASRASVTEAPSAASSGGEAAADEAAADEAARAEQERRIRELEARLALRAAEVRDLRSELAQRPAAVHLGRERCGHEDADEALASPSAESEVLDGSDDDAGPRPVLRLYGSAPASAEAAGVAALPGPPAPAFVPPPPLPSSFGRLPTVPGGPGAVPAIPEVPVVVGSSPPVATPAPPPAGDPVVREYQQALAHVEGRRWAQALEALGRFVRAHPQHPYADNALYWQGEVLYAQRDYRRAVVVLEAMVARYPSGNKVPDALLRLGTCFERLGDSARAREYFERVQRLYPDSVAARMASRQET